jgi:hypothetical protein
MVLLADMDEDGSLLLFEKLVAGVRFHFLLRRKGNWLMH